MKISIMQPTYLPWTGYFSMIKNVDIFVFLDDVQFDKRSWQQRNKILLNKKEIYLTVPVISKNKSHQKINEVKIDNTENWSQKHFMKIYHAYSKSLSFKKFIKLLEKSYKRNFSNLIDLNIFLIHEICNYLQINTKKVLSSSISNKFNKEKKLLQLCKSLNATEYIAPPGSKNYLNNGEIFLDSNINFSYFNFEMREYDQFNSDKFIPYLSIIDLIFNHGIKSKEYI